jgi:hypothetical protein
MLDWLNHPDDYRPSAHPVVSDRKLRLFACGCCRRIGLHGEAIDAAERWADSGVPCKPPREAKHSGQTWCYRRDAMEAARAWAGARIVSPHARRADLLRDIAGDPFRPLRPIWMHCPDKTGRRTLLLPEEDAPDWAWGDTRQITRLAQAAYDERLDDGTLEPLRLAILADALEEEGHPVELEQHPLRVGDIVESSDPANPLRCGSGIYRHAVVTSLDPFALVSEEGDMLWTATRTPLDVRQVRRTGVNVAAAVARWEREKKQYPPDGRWLPCPHPLLAHLRSPGPHVRGCWALDLILGKE